MITLIASKNYWEKEKGLYRAEITALRDFKNPLALEEIYYRELLLDTISRRLIALNAYDTLGAKKILADERQTDRAR